MGRQQENPIARTHAFKKTDAAQIWGAAQKNVERVYFDEHGRAISKDNVVVPQLDGLLKLERIPSAIFEDLVQTHKTIIHRTALTAWSGGSEEKQNRKKAYGFIDTLAQDKLTEIEFHNPYLPKQEWKTDKESNESASVVLNKTSRDMAQAAVAGVLATIPFASLISNGYRDLHRFGKIDELICLQPNLQGDTICLNEHMDWPLHDGFGKIILTIAIAESAMILLTKLQHVQGVQPSWKFRLEEGEGYILAGKTRSNFYHGVIADTLGRQSLNLRFGLHSLAEGLPIYTRWHKKGVAPPKPP